MIEIPESYTLARQAAELLSGKTILNATANASPHKFAWFLGNPARYQEILSGKTVSGAKNHGGRVELLAGDAHIVFTDGVNLRIFQQGEKLPNKHQLLIEFDDFSYLIATVSMYGGLEAFLDGQNQNPYDCVAREKSNPLTSKFDETYFHSLTKYDTFDKDSAKAFLATGQKIPGLGNGVLQDILWNAGIHPKRKMGTVTDKEFVKLYHAVKATLVCMAQQGGRDTERDLFGGFGGYRTVLSKNSWREPCPACGNKIIKEAYLGGSIYFCPICQPLSV